MISEAIREKKRAHDRRYREANRALINARQKAYDDAHRTEVRAQKREYYRKHKDLYKRNYRAYRWRRYELAYGLKREEYEALLARQGFVCAVCGKPNWCGKNPFVDHDHTTGEVRGIVCAKCNSALGFINDDIETAKGLVRYLKSARVNLKAVREVITHVSEFVSKEG